MDVAPDFTAMSCRLCGATLVPDESRLGKSAASYETCAYRCEACQVGYSNRQDAATRTMIFAAPERNVPEELMVGLDVVLANAFNVRARGSKRTRFGFFTSEDAVTW